MKITLSLNFHDIRDLIVTIFFYKISLSLWMKKIQWKKIVTVLFKYIRRIVSIVSSHTCNSIKSDFSHVCVIYHKKQILLNWTEIIFITFKKNDGINGNRKYVFEERLFKVSKINLFKLKKQMNKIFHLYLKQQL